MSSLGSSRERAQKSSTASDSASGGTGILDLPPDAQQLAARHQEAEVRAGLEQRRELRGGLHHLLEVVQQQEQLALADVLGQAVLGPQRLRDGLGDEGRDRAGRRARPRRRRS